MQEILISFLTDFGYMGMFMLVMGENIFPPIPSEIILTFGGFLTIQAGLSFPLMIFSSTMGAVVGAILLYWVGAKISIDRLEKFLNLRYIKFLGFKEGDVRKSFKCFEKYEDKSVFLGRCIPVARSLISIPAGINLMPFKKFIFYTSLGSLIWNILLISIGRFAGSSWEQAGNDFYTKIKILFSIIFVCFVFYKIFLKFKRRNGKKL